MNDHATETVCFILPALVSRFSASHSVISVWRNRFLGLAFFATGKIFRTVAKGSEA